MMKTVNNTNVGRWFEIALIGLALLAITWLHYQWVSGPLVYHAFLEFLYYLPVIYAAVRYGIKGGALVALVASLAVSIHLLSACTVDDYIYQIILLILINLIGWVTGIVSEGEKKVAKKYLDLNMRQESLITELELSNKAVAQMNQELEREIAERKTLEEWVRRSERLSATGHLAAGVAHEMRNPIGIIRATMQILAKEEKENHNVRECAPVVIEECDRMNEVVEEFLKFARPAVPQREQFSVSGLFEEVMLFTSKFISRNGIEVITDFEPDLPPIVADKGQMKQVLVNLIINAVEAMPHGGTLQLSTFHDGRQQKIAVKDSGEGIPENELAQIFDPFYSTKARGTGLGLSIVYRILENHNCKIDVCSKPGEGTEFVISLDAEDPSHGKDIGD